MARPIDPFALLPADDRERLMRAATTDVSILLTGETGTGKGQLARAIAARSRRPGLVEVNCAALPDELLGSELFGHRRGAFTGAIAERKGILFAAAGKTVFLDEIGEISPAMQRMLLSAVQRSRRTIKPLGADAALELPPLRFIFATNRELETEVRAGRFREDLLRRIDVVSVVTPALRSRPDLVAGYAGAFLRELSGLHGIEVAGIEKKALRALERYPWPGNVRELKNTLERALVTAPREKAVILRELDLRLTLSSGPSDKDDDAHGRGRLASIEADLIRKAVNEAGGRIKDAAKALGYGSRSSLYNRMKKYGILIEKRPRGGRRSIQG
jgi:transcriptional regulator with PAS, ATPase and Fis domain